MVVVDRRHHVQGRNRHVSIAVRLMRPSAILSLFDVCSCMRSWAYFFEFIYQRLIKINKIPFDKH